MKSRFVEFLEENSLYPINQQNWNIFGLTHSAPKDSEEQAAVRRYINVHIGQKNGLYAYVNSTGRLLYIGKGKPISNRVYSHYLESFKQVSGDHSGRWFRFFSSHQGELTVLWIELEDETIRRIVELLLNDLNPPEFNFFEHD